MTNCQSWGRYPVVEQKIHSGLQWRSESLDLRKLEGTILPYGLGRSYGDVCLNGDNWIIPTRALDRFISLDTQKGLLRCEAGVSLDEILQVIVPRGWFLAVTPGTKFVTVGGAIANDAHGKNHHRAGTFGCHVTQFELLRSDGRRLLCSRDSQRDLFSATVGGMGLTGLITWAEIRLTPIKSRRIDQRAMKFSSLDDFFTLSDEGEKQYSYTVAWIDCQSSGRKLGRGIFYAGNHCETGPLTSTRKPSKLAVPFDFPGFVLNGLSVRAFNWLYYHKQTRVVVENTIDYEPFFYPLDAVGDWNRIYGKRGFFQYQCVVPHKDSAPIRDILSVIAKSGQGSFLAVLKVMGDKLSPGMMSFPRAGVTLALDFPNKGRRTQALFAQLDTIVREAGGRLYSAKDACMTADDFQRYYPDWTEFAKHIDPKFSSSFWRRVTGQSNRMKP
jgi:FAD/FMN-containing dehydrogenase